ncbi:hypothetical protein QTH97_29295 [Variovorax sp. J22R24]|uniref:hypothetical protein n=1 Tax=Variovorax gracilis TaxID=3053502 RepID=UPI002578F125|nr:hypothetical protein [Variovorax sp. J22R24]MDM0109069.1 hypothetical protein [Variovorax sp. J22R24]
MAVAQGTADPSSERKTTPAMSMNVATTKSNHPGVVLRYLVEAPPDSGASIVVQLEFDGVTDLSGAVVRLKADEGLLIGDASTTRTLPAGEITSWSVSVSHTGAGIRYLHVFTTQHGITSIASVPVTVGSGSLLPPSDGQLKISGDEKFIALPVRP